MRHPRWRVGALLLLLPGIASAAPVAALSLSQALARAEASLAVRLAGAEVTRARGARLGQQPLLPGNPLLMFDVGPRRQDSSTLTSFQLRLEQPLDLFGQRGVRLAAADQAVALSQSLRAAIRAAVRAQVRLSYVAVLASQRREVVSRQRVETTKRTHAAARDRMKLGAASDVEHLLAEAELGRAQIALLRAEQETTQLVADLRELLDLPANQPLSLTTALDLPPTRSTALEALVARARKQRQDLQALRGERRLAEAEIRRLQRERFPLVSLALTVQRDTPSDSWYGVGLSFASPLFHRNQGAIAQARALRERADASVDVTTRSLERELRRALDAAAARRREVALYQQSVLGAAERARDLIGTGWRAGKFDLYRLLAAERELLESRLAAVDAWAALWKAEIEIDRATGEESR
jgi:outer membrane protein, heavy metal efflux system